MSSLSSTSIAYLCDLIKITQSDISDSHIFVQLVLADKITPSQISIQYAPYNRFGHRWVKSQLQDDNSICIKNLTLGEKYTLRINYHHMSTIYHRDLVFIAK